MQKGLALRSGPFVCVPPHLIARVNRLSMKRTLQLAGLILGIVLLGVVAILFWGGSVPSSSKDTTSTNTYGFDPAPADRDTFTIMSYNGGHSEQEGATEAHPNSSTASWNWSRTFRLVREIDPDVMGLQNIGLRALQPGRMSPLDSIGRQFEYTGAARAANSAPLTFSFLQPDGESPQLSGQAILSRYPIRQNVRRVLSPPSLFLWRSALYPDRPVQITALDIGGWPLLIMNAHLDASHVETREEQARTINRLYHRLAQKGFPIILLGSFNAEMPSGRSAAFGEGDARSDDDTMELLLDGTNLQPALSSESARVTGQSVGTYPTSNPTEKRDYIFYHPRLIYRTDAEIHCGEASASSSDHCAISMSFFLPRPVDQLPDNPIPDDKLPSLDSLVGR